MDFGTMLLYTQNLKLEVMRRIDEVLYVEVKGISTDETPRGVRFISFKVLLQVSLQETIIPPNTVLLQLPLGDRVLFDTLPFHPLFKLAVNADTFFSARGTSPMCEPPLIESVCL